MIKVLLKNGYVKQDYGYVRKTKDNTHWVTVFKIGSIQMYAYDSEDDDDYVKIYDTGIIGVTKKELQSLIDIFIKNHN